MEVSLRSLLSLALLTILTSCDPYDFGYKKNPAYVLHEVFKSIVRLDDLTFQEHSSLEAKCTYGNDKGLNYLNMNIPSHFDQIKLEYELLSSEYNIPPKFTGFWSYYTERYQINIYSRKKTQPFAKAIVDCQFGIDGHKDDRYLRQKPQSYELKECKLIKLVPVAFPELPLTEKCRHIRVMI